MKQFDIKIISIICIVLCVIGCLISFLGPIAYLLYYFLMDRATGNPQGDEEKKKTLYIILVVTLIAAIAALVCCCLWVIVNLAAFSMVIPILFAIIHLLCAIVDFILVITLLKDVMDFKAQGYINLEKTPVLVLIKFEYLKGAINTSGGGNEENGASQFEGQGETSDEVEESHYGDTAWSTSQPEVAAEESQEANFDI
jgi:hypothetical protein